MAKRIGLFGERTPLVIVLIILFSICTKTFAEQENSNEQTDFFDMSIEELMNVQVTTVSKKEDALFATPAAITVITSEDIRQSGLQSVPEVLRMVPGLHVAKIDSNLWAISARGFNGRWAGKLLVMIDGRSVYTPLFSGVYWDVQDLMLEDVERIEVIKGPGGTLWGANAVNGIINIITKNAADTQGTLLTGGIGTEEKGFTSLRHGGKLGENAYYRTYAKYFTRDEAIYANGDHANDASDALRGGFRIDWNKSEQDNITLQGDFYDGHSAQRTRLTSPGVNFQVDDNADIRGLNLLTRWTQTYSETSDMSLQFYYDRTERYGIELGESRDTFDLDFQHRFQLIQNHNLIWGLGYRHTGDNIENSYTISFDPSNYNQKLITGFVQDEITIIEEQLKCIVGTKVEKNDYTDFEFQPSARLLWTPNNQNTVWTAFTHAISTPSRSTVHMTNKYNEIPLAMQFTGNKDLKSLEVNSYELGYRVQVKDNLLLDFALFYNEYDNLFTKENNPTAFNTIRDNKMYGETYGSEVAAHWQVNKNWKMTGGYTFLRMQMHTQSSSTNTTAAPRIEKESPRNMFNLSSQLQLEDDLDFNTSFYYVDNVPQYDIPSYIRLDMGLTWHISEDMDISVFGQNLLDRSHPEYGDDGTIYTEAERGVYGKLTWRF